MDRVPEPHVWRQCCVRFWRNVHWHVTRQGRDRLVLTAALVGLILFGTSDAVLWVRLSRKMEGFEWFLSQVAMTAAFCAISWPVTWYQMFVSRTISREVRNGHPMRVYAMTGMLDAMATMMGTLPLPYVPGPVVSVLSKISVPLLMVGSIVYLRTRYQVTHYLGALVILAGVAVNLVPFLLDAPGGGATQDNPYNWFWVALVLAAVVPGVASNLVKERALKGAPSNVWHFNAWVALFQLGWGAAMAWVAFVPFPPPATHIRVTAFPRYLLDSVACFAGESSAPDACHETWAVFAVFIALNVLLNVLMLYVFKAGSAVLATVVGASTLVLTNMAFHLPLLAGEAEARGLSAFNVAALLIIVGGILLYHLRDEESRNAAKAKQTVAFLELLAADDAAGDDAVERVFAVGTASSTDDEEAAVPSSDDTDRHAFATHAAYTEDADDVAPAKELADMDSVNLSFSKDAARPRRRAAAVAGGPESTKV